AQRLGCTQDVGGDAVIHISVEMAGTTYATLHFVKNQQGIMFIGQLTQPSQKIGIGRGYAAFALDRLYHDGTRVVVHQFSRGFKIVVFAVHNAAGQRAKALGVLFLTADGYGEKRAAMESLLEGNNLV